MSGSLVHYCAIYLTGPSIMNSSGNTADQVV